MGVSTVAQGLAVPSGFERIQAHIHNRRNWTYLIPTVGTIALGILLSPNFAIGLGFGAGLCLLNIAGAAVLSSLKLINPDENSKYAKFLDKHPLRATIIAPIAEEIVFRGFLQPFTARIILLFVPAAGAALMGSGLSIAITASVVATAALFGLAHASNPHKNARLQAVTTGLTGIGLGLIAAQFGLGASIAAHMAMNTMLITLITLSRLSKPHPEPKMLKI